MKRAFTHLKDLNGFQVRKRESVENLGSVSGGTRSQLNNVPCKPAFFGINTIFSGIGKCTTSELRTALRTV